MSKKINRIGLDFGRLHVFASAATKNGRAQWWCACECGVMKIISAEALTSGFTQSCGCFGREKRIERNTKHGQAKRGNKTVVYNLWQAASKRARKFGVTFTLKLDDIVVPKVCPILGVPIFTGTRINHDNSPSLDRKIASEGYTPSNSWVISYRANRIKNDATLEELEAIVKALKDQNGNI